MTSKGLPIAQITQFFLGRGKPDFNSFDTIGLNLRSTDPMT